MHDAFKYAGIIALALIAVEYFTITSKLNVGASGTTVTVK